MVEVEQFLAYDIIINIYTEILGIHEQKNYLSK
jgi:hypothetical protein